MRSKSFIAVFSVIAAALAASGVLADTGDAAEGLLAVDRAWAAAARGGAPQEILAFWSTDAINYYPGMAPAHGREAIAEIVKRNRERPGFALSWEPEHAVVAESGELGYTRGSFVLSFEGPDGSTVRKTGHYVCIWKRLLDGSWKCSVETSVFDGGA